MEGSPLADELADQLAERLERLGLAEQLGPAGLPTFTRDDAGRAHWCEPGTGEPLPRPALERLAQLLTSEGEDPAHAVPVGLVQLRREARVRAELLAGGWLDYAGLGERRGTSADAARFAVHKAAERGAVLLVPHDGGVLVPAFQLDDDGEVREELLPVLEPLLTAGLDPWRTWIWLTQPAALTGGQVPHEAARDPEEQPLVRAAAARLAERARASR